MMLICKQCERFSGRDTSASQVTGRRLQGRSSEGQSEGPVGDAADWSGAQAHTYSHSHTHRHTHTHTHTHTHIHSCVTKHTHTLTHTCTQTLNASHTYTHVQRTHINACEHTHRVKSHISVSSVNVAYAHSYAHSHVRTLACT